MADLRVASRYVKSLLGLSVEKGVLEEVHKDMLLFSKTCRESRPFVAMLRSPVIRHENKQQILRKLFSKKVNLMTMSILDIITKIELLQEKYHYRIDIITKIILC